MTSLHLDWETRSTVDLKAAGVYVYAQHEDTDIWCAAWALGEDEPDIWHPGLPVPQAIINHVEAGREIVAHNAQFERVIWKHIATPRYGWPVAAMEQFVCTAAMAAAMALPRHLGGVAEVLGVKQKKDDAGYRTMLRMARPRRVNEDGTVTWWDTPDKLAILYSYCKQDLRAERAVEKCLRRLPPREREIYLLDQRMNDRGVRVDRELVAAAKTIVDIGVTRANARLDDLTGGAVSKISHNGRLAAWLNENDVATDSVAKPAIAALLERDDLAQNVVEVLQLRAEAGRSSVAKLKSFEAATCRDGHARGLLMYHGASTGRWTGKLIQPQNFPRGEVEDIESYIPAVLAGDYDGLDLLHPPIVVVLSMLRSMLTAEPGHDLMAGDFAAIEARVLNWLAGQEDVVARFARGEDVYKYNAATLYGIPLEQVQKFPHRQTGKFQELGCGFGMGAEKAVSAAKTVYGLDLSPELAQEVVDSYRETHPRVKAFWTETHDACMDAVRAPGRPVKFGAGGRLTALKAGQYLYVVLPSKRPLMYAAPSVEERVVPWCDVCGKREKEHTAESGHDYTAATRPSLHFWGVDSFSRKWGKMAAYGGLLVENIVQAVARDLMAEAMLRLESAGYEPRFSCHDEIVCDVPQGFGNLAEFEHLMTELPEWAAGCPVAAEGWRGERYRK